ncbi:MAG TPA: hypothetical protein VFE17_02975, partial [Candidatus Baltobacteraceae bacterium]|nr:hypothetical protein [Candidatus Baltobacteraceae bacterium]
AVAGTRDFVNWSLLWPEDKGIFGILGDPMHAFAVVVVLLIAAGTVALLADGYSWLFGKASPAFGIAFALVCFASTIRVYPLDVIFCLCAGAVIALTLYRLWAMRQEVAAWKPVPMLRVLTSVLLAIVTIAFSGGDFLWTAIGIAFACAAYTSEVGMCDIALALGAVLLLKVQPGFGWLSFCGYLALIAAAAWVVVRIARRAPQPPIGQV